MKSRRSILTWLFLLQALILCMIAVGGITRLTESGLSMTDWKPILGSVPPLSEADWIGRFEQYKQFPEFIKLRSDMTLPEFKFIFIWEYLHRMLGRVIGLVYLFPMLYFVWIRKAFRDDPEVESGRSSPWPRRLSLGFMLLVAQGLMGWFMVLSGLSDRPAVSHFRLAAHLSMAFALFLYLASLIIRLRPRPVAPEAKSLRGLAILTFLCICVQVVFGAFVAGLKAGKVFNTWPKMGRSWIPDEVIDPALGIGSLVQLVPSVQFVHRWLAVPVVILACWLGWKAMKRSDLVAWGKILFALVLAQFALGVWALLSAVALPVAVAHQLNACLVLLATFAIGFRGRAAD